MEKELMELLSKFSFAELIGFATYLKVDSKIIKETTRSAAVGKTDVEELVCSTVENFSNMRRDDRRRIMKLVKKVAGDSQKIEVK